MLNPSVLNPDGDYILWLAIVGIVGLVDDSCNDQAIAVGQTHWSNVEVD
ncbi:hypothetical protein VB735_04545 [Halotia wernerae UHCC 0503]|nr:hypothetical protein [Halotia wernerae UHCC 0503]